MAFLESNQEIIDGRTECHNIEYRAKNRHGEWGWMRCRSHLERDENGAPSLFAGIITNLGKKNKIDPLTGLFNKFEFKNTVRQLVEECSSPLMVLLFGIIFRSGTMEQSDILFESLQKAFYHHQFYENKKFFAAYVMAAYFLIWITFPI